MKDRHDLVSGQCENSMDTGIGQGPYYKVSTPQVIYLQSKFVDENRGEGAAPMDFIIVFLVGTNPMYVNKTNIFNQKTSLPY